MCLTTRVLSGWSRGEEQVERGLPTSKARTVDVREAQAGGGETWAVREQGH